MNTILINLTWWLCYRASYLQRYQPRYVVLNINWILRGVSFVHLHIRYYWYNSKKILVFVLLCADIV